MRREAPPAHLSPASVASTRIGACRGSLEDRPGALDDGLEGRGRGGGGQARQIAGDRSRRSSVVRGARARRRRSRTVVVARAGASGSPRCERRGEREGASSAGEPCRCRERRGLGSVARAREPASPAIGGVPAKREAWKLPSRGEKNASAAGGADAGAHLRFARLDARLSSPAPGLRGRSEADQPDDARWVRSKAQECAAPGAPARSKRAAKKNPLLRNTRVCRWAGSSPLFD